MKLKTLITLLQVLFIGLKLTNNIDWSWVWVLSPLWIVVSILFLVALINSINEVNEREEGKGKSSFQDRLEEMAKKKTQ